MVTKTKAPKAKRRMSHGFWQDGGDGYKHLLSIRDSKSTSEQVAKTLGLKPKRVAHMYRVMIGRKTQIGRAHV